MFMLKGYTNPFLIKKKGEKKEKTFLNSLAEFCQILQKGKGIGAGKPL